MLGSNPANANIFSGDSKFLISPNSAIIDPADISAIPGIESIWVSNFLTDFIIYFSMLSICSLKQLILFT